MAKKYFCKDCGEEKSKKGIYCKVCRYKYARRPSGLKYNIKVKNKAWFKKGDVPWNEGKELPYDVWNKGTKGLCKPNITSFKAEDVTGEKNSKWKGEDVGYSALHAWMKRNFDWSDSCESCGSNKNLHLANVKYHYNRDPGNWKILCQKCHFKYDSENNWGYAAQTFKLNKKIMSKKVRCCISGAAGFVGSHLVEHTMKNTDWDVVALVKMDRAGDLNRLQEIIDDHPEWEKRIKVVRHDLNDSLVAVHKHIGEVDYIAHLAACSHVDTSIKEPVEVFCNNARSTVQIFEYARTLQPNLKKLLYFSTDEVYGPAPEGYDFTEEDKLHPSNPYSAGKAAGEMIAMAYGVTYGTPYLITNTMNIFGERQDPEKLIPKCMQFIQDGKPMTIHGTPGNVGKRHWLHARNAADAVIFLLQNPIVKDKVHIVGDVEMDNLQMFKLVAKYMGKESVEEGKDFVYVDFHSTRPGHDSRYAMSGKKLADLGWVAPVEFESSLEKTVKWTLERPNWVSK